MASGRDRALALAVVLGVLPRGLAGQGSATLPRALDLESAGKCREAVALYRQALGEGDPAGALLGLERCYSQLGQPDSLLAIVDSVLLRRPRDPVARLAKLRTYAGARRDEEARLAFEQWVAAVPRDPAPFREYARLLLDNGRIRATDTVLEFATRALGGAREIAAELAELRAALGMWDASARAWRDAMSYAAFLEQSAVFVLTPTPGAARDSVREVLAAAPIELHARRILAGLELRWRSAREAWNALSALAPSDSARQAWLEFAAEAEQYDAWLTARDAWAHALRHGAGRAVGLRAAAAALQGNDATSALEFITSFEAQPDTASAGTLVLLRVRALSQLGRAEEAETLIATRGAALDPVTMADAVRAVAWGWVRVGDVPKARAALARGGEEKDERATAWMALYEGDLGTARAGLRRLEETSREAVLAMALLARTRADSSAAIGRAFLALARRDTAAAAPQFEEVASELTDAAPLLLGIAARLYAGTADSSRSITLWQTVLERYPEAPEAPEAELDWARLLRRRGDAAGAIARLEHLILTYPQSALVPQARRELELARGAVPPQA
jgi:hypothetical protein